MLKVQFFSFRFLSAIILFFALLIRLTVRDTFFIFATFYYITPWAALFIFALLISCLYFRKKELKSAGLFGSLAILLAVMWLYTGYSKNQRGFANQPQRLMFWNAAHAKYGTVNAIEHVKSLKADVVGIAEAGRTDEAIAQWKQAFSDRTVEVLKGEMLLLTTGTILEKESGKLARTGNYNWFKLSFGEKIFSLLLVDIDPNPSRSREPAFVALKEFIQMHKDENLIIMGDFNTPLDSVFFDSFKESFYHAFKYSGNGFAATWPEPIPVLTIDHVWFGKEFQLIESRLHQSWSDHRSILVEFQFPGENL
jgi:vancomycin resistance protein VanJ